MRSLANSRDPFLFSLLRNPSAHAALIGDSRSRVLVNAADPSAGNALFMATAGVWTAGEGRIHRPPDSNFFTSPTGRQLRFPKRTRSPTDRSARAR